MSKGRCPVNQKPIPYLIFVISGMIFSLQNFKPENNKKIHQKTKNAPGKNQIYALTLYVLKSKIKICERTNILDFHQEFFDPTQTIQQI